LPDASFLFIDNKINMGKGSAVRCGVQAANADYLIHTDIDFPYELNCTLEVFNKLLEGNDVVAGVRNDEYYQHLTLKRKLLSKACRKLNKTFLNIPFADTQSGIKGFNTHGRKI